MFGPLPGLCTSTDVIDQSASRRPVRAVRLGTDWSTNTRLQIAVRMRLAGHVARHTAGACWRAALGRRQPVHQELPAAPQRLLVTRPTSTPERLRAEQCAQARRRSLRTGGSWQVAAMFHVKQRCGSYRPSRDFRGVRVRVSLRLTSKVTLGRRDRPQERHGAAPLRNIAIAERWSG